VEATEPAEPVEFRGNWGDSYPTQAPRQRQPRRARGRRSRCAGRRGGSRGRGGAFGDGVSKDDARSVDGELADLRFVQAGASLHDGQRAFEVGPLAHVLEQHDVVGQVGDAELRQAFRLEQVAELQAAIGEGPWLTTMHRARAVPVEDLLADPRWARLVPDASAHDVRGLLVRRSSSMAARSAHTASRPPMPHPPWPSNCRTRFEAGSSSSRPKEPSSNVSASRPTRPSGCCAPRPEHPASGWSIWPLTSWPARPWSRTARSEPAAEISREAARSSRECPPPSRIRRGRDGPPTPSRRYPSRLAPTRRGVQGWRTS
jgi:hypothetical protein